VLQFDDPSFPEGSAKSPGSLWEEKRHKRVDPFQGGQIIVIKVGVGHEYRVQFGQILHLHPCLVPSSQYLDPVTENRIGQEVSSIEFYQDRCVPHKGDSHSRHLRTFIRIPFSLLFL